MRYALGRQSGAVIDFSYVVKLLQDACELCASVEAVLVSRRRLLLS